MARIKRVLRLVFRNIYYYRVDYIRLLLISVLVETLLVLPAITIMFRFAIDIIGVRSITEQNIWQVASNPLILFVAIIAALIVLLFIYYEMGMLFLLAYHQQRALNYTLVGLWKRLNKKVTYFFNFQLLILLVYLLLLAPLISTVLPISILQNIAIPRFIVDELMGSTQGKMLYFGVITVLVIVTLRFVFTLPYFAVYHWMTIWEAMKLSWKFSSRRLLDMLGLLALILTVHVTLSFIILSVVFTPLFIIERFVPSAALVTAAFTLALAQGVLMVLFTLLQALFSQVLVLVGFSLTKVKPVIVQCESFRKTVLNWSIICATYFFFLFGGINVINLEKTLYEPTTKGIAHRGFMEQGPENTMSSIFASAKAGAQMVEIDIQQTKDGKFIVFHDKTLSRLAGRNEAVYNLTQSELMEVTVSQNGNRDTIPSLEQVLNQAEKLGILLLIEIKTHGFETEDFLPRLISLLNQYGVTSTHWIQSLDVEMMQHLNEMEPSLIVGATYAISLGAIPNDGVDFVAIEQSFVTKRLIEQSKDKNTPLLVWTVNDLKGMQRFLEQNVGGIITNHPDVLAAMQQKFDKEQYFLSRILNKIQYIF
ncbi:MAG: glycerophosphoryl diester phosphodiesterase membrane domain-containing protein [Lysinibacillus sp.]